MVPQVGGSSVSPRRLRGQTTELDYALQEGFPKTLERLLAGSQGANELLDVFSFAGAHCSSMSELRVWWLGLMVEGGHPLREKLTLFWHNHFATSVLKVRDRRAMYEQNLLLRKHALGKFRPFLLDISKNPAMLIWLDSNKNIKDAPNENFAREVMELFSLGTGNYTEKDIREAARAFTGWFTSSPFSGVTFDFSPENHDEGEKTVFGQKGNWNGEDIVRFCCDQPACAKFLVGKLYAFFVSETPPPKGLLTPLEDRFRKSDYDIADLAKTMLGSRLFFSEHAYRKRVKWPVEFVLEAANTLTSQRTIIQDLPDLLPSMGQTLFAPPNVKGWRTGTDWLNSTTVLARNNFVETAAVKEQAGKLVVAEAKNPDEPIIHLPTRPSRNTLATLLGAELLSESKKPEEDIKDSVDVLCSAKSKSRSELVAQLGELLYGERLPSALAERIEKFIREPTVIASSEKPVTVQSYYYPPPDTTIPLIPAENPGLAPPPRKVANKPKTPNPGSPEFNLRIREALHAMMCLPEYQLN